MVCALIGVGISSTASTNSSTSPLAALTSCAAGVESGASTDGPVGDMDSSGWDLAARSDKDMDDVGV